MSPAAFEAAAFSAASAGWRMPAEFEPHAATWMAWPCRESLWGESFEAVKADYARLASAIARFEPLIMVAPAHLADEARRLCGCAVHVLPMPIDDSWARDSGPTFLVDDAGGLLATAFTFNAWGGKYHPHDEDARLAARIGAHLQAPVQSSPLVFEGGAILSDGEGTLLTTETCLLHPNRNPGMSRSEVEAELRRMLGARCVIWLPGDPTEDETNGHIDGLLSLSAPGHALLESIEDTADERHRILAENRRALELATDARGRRFEILSIEEAPRETSVGSRYCRSYVNFYPCNGAVMAPAYGVPADARVKKLLGRAFPDREIVMLPIGAIAIGGGGFHCITQQQPAAVPRKASAPTRTT
ncbi:MAG: agmatine deiminase family protein [Steroidobacteraceae bacterium]